MNKPVLHFAAVKVFVTLLAGDNQEAKACGAMLLLAHALEFPEMCAAMQLLDPGRPVPDRAEHEALMATARSFVSPRETSH